jgi:hypothetical protein
MSLEKNISLYPQVKSILIKPVNTDNSVIKTFQEIYNSPSKIKFRSNSKLVAAGLEYSTRIDAVFPGLKEEDFINFHDFLQQRYVVIIEFVDQKRYQVSFTETPLKLNSSFDEKTGFTLSFIGKTFYNYKYVGTTAATNQVGFAYTLTVRF